MPNPPMCKVEFYCPEGGVAVPWTDTYNNVMVFQCEKYTENPAGGWYMVLKDTRQTITNLKQKIVSKRVVKVWIGRVTGGVPMTPDYLVWQGIVDSVAENEHVSAKSSYTELVVTGRCMGGILIDMPITFQNWGKGYDDWFRFSYDYHGDEPTIWLRQMMKDFVFNTRDCPTPWGQWIRECYTGTPIKSLVVRPQWNVTVWSFMEQVWIKPWIEMFIEVAGPDAGCLKYRVKPWGGLDPQIPDASNNLGQSPKVKAPSAQGRWIRRENFISQKTQISDVEYFNHVQVNTMNNIMSYQEDIMQPCQDTTAPVGAGDGVCGPQACQPLQKHNGEMGQFGCQEDLGCLSRYGLRGMLIDVNLGYPNTRNQDVTIPQNDAQQIANDVFSWYDRPYERAEITVRGDIYFLGSYVHDEHTLGWDKWWYIEGVSQEYVWGDHWYTTLHCSESRAQPFNSGWGAEFCVGGGGAPSKAIGTFNKTVLYPGG